MTEKEKEMFLEDRYPLTITADRFGGTYSGGRYLAFPLEPRDMPEGASAEDVACAMFWSRYREPVGRGNTPGAALQDLLRAVARR